MSRPVPGSGAGLVTEEMVGVLRGVLVGDEGPLREFEARYRGAGDTRVERGLDLLWKATFEVLLHRHLGPEPTKAAVVQHVADFRAGLPVSEDPGAVVAEKIVRGFYGDVEALQSLEPEELATFGVMLMHLVAITEPTDEQLDELLEQARSRAEELAAQLPT